jgi:hypothetical protein
MVKNKELEEAVLLAMYNFLKVLDPTLEVISEGDEVLGRELIRVHAETRIDEKHKVRIHLQRFIGYGYDFNEEDGDGNSARKIYERAVRNTKEFGGRPHLETLVAEGVKDKIGWYITRI